MKLKKSDTDHWGHCCDICECEKSPAGREVDGDDGDDDDDDEATKKKFQVVPLRILEANELRNWK